MLEELCTSDSHPAFTWMSLKAYRNPKSRSQDEVLLSLPTTASTALHWTAWINTQLSRNYITSKPWFPLNIKKNGKHFHSHNYQHYHFSSHLLLQNLIVMIGTPLPPFLGSGESLCKSAAVICFPLHELKNFNNQKDFMAWMNNSAHSLCKHLFGELWHTYLDFLW